MRYRTFLVTGMEVLQLGGQGWVSNGWPIEHWRAHSGRWRLFTSAIDEFVSRELNRATFGSTVDGLVVALEIADFAAWPTKAFARPDAPHSYKPKYRDWWCFAKLTWPEVMNLSLAQQYRAYVTVVLASIQRLEVAPRKPRGLDVPAMRGALAAVFARGKPSQFTRATSRATADA